MAISLASIQRGVSLRPPRIGMHSAKGMGKTTFAACAPKTIFIQTEDGEGTLDIARFPLCKSFQDVLDCIGVLATEDHGFQNVTVDSLDWLEPLIWAHTCAAHGQPSIEAFGYGKGYLEALVYWRQFFDGINYLRDHKGMGAILLCHTQVKRFEAPDTEPYDRYQLKLHDRAGALFQEWADVLLFANMKTFTTTKKGAFNKEQTRGVSTGERVMFTEERPSHVAKNRYQLPYELPLNWYAFDEAMKASIARNTGSPQSHAAPPAAAPDAPQEEAAEASA